MLEEVKEEAKDEVNSESDFSFTSAFSRSSTSPNTAISENLILTLTNLEFLKKLSKSSIIEVLFILSKLMFGTKKIQVQKRLKKAGIINVANKLYCLLIKTMDSMSPGQDMKIQILKLVINYLSRDSYNLDNKLEWISQEEVLMMMKQEIYPALMANSIYTDLETKKFAKEIAFIPTTIPLKKFNEYDETMLGSMTYDFKLIKDQRGFMSKIIQSFIEIGEESISLNSSNLRYWQASWIESFTRGWNPYLQLFIARSGILKILIKDIITIQTQDDANLQTAFDILGEMIRFNKRTILILESHTVFDAVQSPLSSPPLSSPPLSSPPLSSPPLSSPPLSSPPCKFGKILVVYNFVEKNYIENFRIWNYFNKDFLNFSFHYVRYCNHLVTSLEKFSHQFAFFFKLSMKLARATSS